MQEYLMLVWGQGLTAPRTVVEVYAGRCRCQCSLQSQDVMLRARISLHPLTYSCCENDGAIRTEDPGLLTNSISGIRTLIKACV
jgi:hypothetical protein